MKNKLNQIKETFYFIGMFFILLSLQIWFILTGDE